MLELLGVSSHILALAKNRTEELHARLKSIEDPEDAKREVFSYFSTIFSDSPLLRRGALVERCRKLLSNAVSEAGRVTIGYLCDELSQGTSEVLFADMLGYDRVFSFEYPSEISHKVGYSFCRRHS